MVTFSPTTVGFAFAYCAWGHYCLLQKERNLPDHQDVAASVYYPLVLLTLAAILDNIRLLLGVGYGKKGASRALAQLSHFVQLTILPGLLTTYSSFYDALSGCCWMGTLGRIFTVPLVVNGLNRYLSEVHDYMEYTEEDKIPRYTLSKKRKELDAEELPVTLYVVLGGAVFISLVTWVCTGDLVPLLLQAAVLGGHAAMPFVAPAYRIPINNALELVCLTGLMRIQRYV